MGHALPLGSDLTGPLQISRIHHILNTPILYGISCIYLPTFPNWNIKVKKGITVIIKEYLKQLRICLGRWSKKVCLFGLIMQAYIIIWRYKVTSIQKLFVKWRHYKSYLLSRGQMEEVGRGKLSTVKTSVWTYYILQNSF